MRQNAFKKFQFPAQDGRYSVKVKNGAIWRSYSWARLQISVGMPYHEGEKFEATVNWVKERFEGVHICVNDTLQRYNYISKYNICEEQAQKICQQNGENWIKDNLKYLENIPQYELHRWEDWKKRDNYETYLHQINELYRTNPEFYSAVDLNVEQFLDRQSKKRDMSLSDKRRFAYFSREYLLEETAVFAIMFEECVAVDIYPGSVLLPCIFFRERHLEGAPKGLSQGIFTRIDFARNRNQGNMAA